ncbi:MAG: STT3 domain-containing protein [Caldimicrobium sp.]
MTIIERIFLYGLFLITIAFSLYIRYDDIKLWKANSDQFFYNGEPLYSEYDSFYFARNALDLKENLFKLGEIDHFRFFPDNSSSAKLSDKERFYTEYTLSGNLISYIFYFLNELTGVSVAWLTYYLIPLLATTVVIPLFLYFNRLGVPLVGIMGALVTVSAPMYLGRTCLMRLDHDVLNLTLPFLVGYCFYAFFTAKSNKSKYFWISLASLFLLTYYLWYGHPNLNFVLVLTFFIAYIWEPLKNLLLRKPLNFTFQKTDLIFFAILLVPQAWYLYQGPIHLFQQVSFYVLNIKSPTSAEILFKDFPNILMSISEASRVSFKEALSLVIFNPILGIIGLLGALLLFLFNLRKLIFLLPFFGIGLLVFVSGARFSMYLAPFIGMGIGYLIHLLIERIFPSFKVFYEEHKQKIVLLLLGSVVFLALTITQWEARDISCTPKIDAELVKDMAWLKEKTPINAVIWSWWDYGYAFQLYARRAVFHDGGSQTSPKTYFIARSFTTSDPREAWLITSFVSNYGLTGLAKLLQEGISVEQIFEKIRNGEYSKPINAPIYWVFTKDLIPKFGWIHYFGSYDFKKKEGIFGKILVPVCRIISTNLLECPELDNARLDLNNGLILVKNETYPVKELYFRDKNSFHKKEFYPQGFVVEIVKGANNQTGLFVVQPPSDKTLFNTMFILRDYDPRYFELVYDNFPNMVVYKVKSQ